MSKPRYSSMLIRLTWLPAIKMVNAGLNGAIKNAIVMHGKHFEAGRIDLPDRFIIGCGAKIIFNGIEELLPVLNAALVMVKIQVFVNGFFKKHQVALVEASLKKYAVYLF